MTPRRSRCVVVAVFAFVGSTGACDAFASSGLNLGWGPYCPTSASSGWDQSNPCDGSTGASYQLIGSSRSPIALPNCVAEEITLEFQTASQFLSDYWHLENEHQPGQSNPAGCRGTNSATGNIGSMRVSAADGDFPAVFTGCRKFWGASPAGGINFIPGYGAPNRARLDMTWTRDPGAAMNAWPSQYGSFSILLDTNHQDGLDPNFPPPKYSCEGCLWGACITYNICILRQPPGTTGGDVVITNEDIRRSVAWQFGVGLGACAPAPVHRTTWGQVKSLYR